MGAKDVHKFVGYGVALALAVGGGVMAKFVDDLAGGAMVAAGAFLLGKLGAELLPGRAP